MKKNLLSLIAVLGTITMANAQTWVAPESGSENVAPNTVLVNNDDVTVTTVYSAKVTGYSATIGSYAFTSAIQLRVDGAPTAAVPTGTEKADCTPLVISAKADETLTVYYRRQSNSGSYAAGDGKDIKLIDQANLATIEGSMTLHSSATDYSPASQVFSLTKGHTYTLFARGTTGQLYGFDVETGDAEVPEVTTFYYSFDSNGAVVTSYEESNVSTITYSDGATMSLLKKQKSFANGNNIMVDGKTYKTIKCSNGAQNFFCGPEGKVIKYAWIYSYVNKKEADYDGQSYWKEINGESFGAFDLMTCTSDNLTTPDERLFKSGESNNFTFTNAGTQVCFVIKVEYFSSEEMERVDLGYYAHLRAMDAAGRSWGTLSLTYDATIPEDVDVFTATVEGSDVTLHAIEGGVVPANTGVLIRSRWVNGVFRKADSAAGTLPANDLLATGNMPLNAPANSYVLACKNSDVKFCLSDVSNLIIPANKAYLVAEGVSAAALRIVDETTAITTLADEQALGRQLFDLQGRQLQEAQGLHIQGGKIQFVK